MTRPRKSAMVVTDSLLPFGSAEEAAAVASVSDDGGIHDEVGYWSEIKLQIMREYLPAYSKILRNHKLHHIYVDAFAGSGKHLSKTTGEFVAGSPTIALTTIPPFREYRFIDMNRQKVAALEKIVADRADVRVGPTCVCITVTATKFS
jgi:three-Cys-motif partner protein